MKDSRELAILDHVRARRTATVTELADVLDASVATIRRDLQRLDDTGRLRRTHGGAVAIEHDAPFAEVEAVNLDAKQRIAARAVAEIVDGQSVLLDIGTTTVQVAGLLRGRPVTIVTPSLKVYEVLRDDRDVKLILLPGDYDPVYHAVSGHLTTECLRMVHVDHAFLGVSGIADNGDLRDTTTAQIPIKRAVGEIADRCTVLADASKFPGTGAGSLDPSGWLQSVITDRQPGGAVRSALADRHIRVVLA